MKTSDLKVLVIPQLRPGGQHVGSIPTTVSMEHVPTGLKASCGCERSQMKNRQVCLAMIEYGLAEIGWIDE
jgi:peptide chain release factor 2